MENWRNLLIRPSQPIGHAIEVIDRGGVQVAMVVDGEEKLLGMVTDGDVRRGILRSLPMDARVSEIMGSSPLVGLADQTAEEHRRIMEANFVRQLPIVDSERRVIGLALDNSIPAFSGEPHRNWVVLMAGGAGSRLRPLTEETPKPLLKVGNKPLLEIIIKSFIAQGFRRFYISVNYKGEQVKSHFGDGAAWGAEIRYLEEDTSLGTAGSLALIEERPTMPFVVMNGDLLTKVSFQNLLDFHAEQRSTATMCVQDYDFQVPFGVVEMRGMKIASIKEKPMQRFLVNAGIYMLDPEVFEFIPGPAHLDMTDLFGRLIEAGRSTTVFPIREYWLDIGRLDDLELARESYPRVFEDPS